MIEANVQLKMQFNRLVNDKFVLVMKPKRLPQRTKNSEQMEAVTVRPVIAHMMDFRGRPGETSLESVKKRTRPGSKDRDCHPQDTYTGQLLTKD
jgi:hypothetical protein